MSGWNRPTAEETARKEPFGSAPSRLKGVFAGAIVVVLGIGAWFLFSGGEAESLPRRERGRPSPAAAGAAKPVPRSAPEETHKEKVRRIQAEFSEQVREYIKKKPTNEVHWVVAPLDPDDPDNALRTSIARDIGTILSIPPGEDIPPCIPFSFMFEDDAIEAAAARGEKVLSVDGGNAKFIEDLKRWKVTVKEGDSEARIAAKNALVDAQIELLKGMDEGMSVNDSIRAAYRFRIEAAKTRKSMIETIRELHADDPDVATTRELLRKANEQLAAEGIIPIQEESVIPEEDL